VGAMPRVSQAETEELVASKLWGVCYPAELQRPAPLGQPFELILHDQLATQATVWLPAHRREDGAGPANRRRLVDRLLVRLIGGSF
jgi:hypothetical protein